MDANPYDDILKRAQAELTQEQQQRLSEVLAQHAGRKNGGRHSILDLEGLGAEIWKDVDPDDYVAKERESWDG
jgi:hypothetical protein